MVMRHKLKCMRVVKLEKEDAWGSCGAFAMSQPLI